MTDADHKVFTREILLGFWKVHILHHANRLLLPGLNFEPITVLDHVNHSRR